MVDEARYENARWWRNLNRLMCIIGVLIIAAIVGISRILYYEQLLSYLFRSPSQLSRRKTYQR